MKFLYNVGKRSLDEDELDEGTWEEVSLEELKDRIGDSRNCCPLALIGIEDDCLYFDSQVYDS